MSTMRVGDVNIEYYVEGAGPPLLMLGGVGSHAGTWGEPFLAQMRARFQVIRLSNRGMGSSDPGSGALTQGVMADDAARLLQELGIKSADVFGYSMGGYIAQELALNHPRIVQRLVLGCTNCGPAKSVPQSQEDIASVSKIMSSAGEDFTRGFCMIMVSEEFAQNRVGFMNDMVEAHRSTSNQAFGRQMAAIAAFDSSERLASIEYQALIIHGDEDIVIAPGNADFLAERIPNARVQIIPRVGHMFMWERPEETAEIVEEFLSEVPAAPR